MAPHHRFDLAQRTSARQLGEQQANELIARLEAAHALVRTLLGDEFIEIRPRNQFEDVVEHSIGVAHGVGPISCPDESRNSGDE